MNNNNLMRHKKKKRAKLSVKEIHEIFKRETSEFGDSIWESLSFHFTQEEVEIYSSWLVNKGYITKFQSDRWFDVLRQVYDGENEDALDEYTNIEAMTLLSTDFFPIDVFDHFDIPDLENYEVDLKSANEKGLYNVPFILNQEDPDEYNEMYLNNVLYVISEFVYERQDVYSEVLDEFLS